MKTPTGLMGIICFYLVVLFAGYGFAESGESTINISEQVQTEQDKININTATLEELAIGLKGIGVKKAQNIINYRDQYGPFTHIDQLQNVPGIGLATLEKNLERLIL